VQGTNIKLTFKPMECLTVCVLLYMCCKSTVLCAIYIPLLTKPKASAVPPKPYRYEHSLKYDQGNFKYFINFNYDTMEMQTCSGILFTLRNAYRQTILLVNAHYLIALYVLFQNTSTALADHTNKAQHTEYQEMFSLYFISNIKYFTRCANICTCKRLIRLATMSDYSFA
jgi:hypothetical protein